MSKENFDFRRTNKELNEIYEFVCTRCYPSSYTFEHEAYTPQMILWSQWKQLLKRYLQAQILLQQSLSDNSIYSSTDSAVTSDMYYECALIFYNIVIDLSWQIVHTFLIHTYKNNDELKFIKNVDDIKILKDVMDQLTKSVQNPESPDTCELHKYSIALEKTLGPHLDEVKNFWKKIREGEHSLRHEYNVLKHRAAPEYFIGENDLKRNFVLKQCYPTTQEIPVDSKDYIDCVRLPDAQQLLFDFANKDLFAYIASLYRHFSNLIQDM